MIQVSAILKQTEIFIDLNEEQIKAIAEICTPQIYNAGDLIVKENSGSDDLYLIAQGEVDILLDPSLVSEQPDPSHVPTVIATLRRGQSFGEIALVDRGLRSAAARAAEADTQLLRISRDELLSLCESDLLLGYRLMRNLAADLALKMRSTDMRIRESLL